MSRNCVDATINVANRHKCLLMLVASRRQIDSREFGGGYVNNWDTRSFADYVRERDKGGFVKLARDHGGPWQNDKEQLNGLNINEAMESAKRSFREDIDAGFSLLHIDPSIDINGCQQESELVKRVRELYQYCWEYSMSQDKEIHFEVGTEEQSGNVCSGEDFEKLVESIEDFCGRLKMRKPTFVVAQTGTKVKEMENVGKLDVNKMTERAMNDREMIRRIVEICNKHGLMLKAHNADYLTDEMLRWHPKVGIHAINIAPELGVEESKALIEILEENGQKDLAEKFIELAYNSRCWKKWLKPHSKLCTADKALIAGHYVYSTNEFKELEKIASLKLERLGICLRDYLREMLEKKIESYANLLNLV